jgi:hypothetical protein
MLYSYPPPTAGGLTGGHATPPYPYHPPLAYPYPPPQSIHSRGGDNSGGGKNTSRTTQTPTMMKKKMSGPMATRKIWYLSISSFRCRSLDYYVVLANSVFRFMLGCCVLWIALNAMPNLK